MDETVSLSVGIRTYIQYVWVLQGLNYWMLKLTQASNFSSKVARGLRRNDGIIG